MGKFAKNMYTTSKGERRLNCYVIHIPKEIVDKTDLVDKELKIYIDNDKIVIDKK